jgi:hypothetical protein
MDIEIAEKSDILYNLNYCKGAVHGIISFYIQYIISYSRCEILYYMTKF